MTCTLRVIASKQCNIINHKSTMIVLAITAEISSGSHSTAKSAVLFASAATQQCITSTELIFFIIVASGGVAGSRGFHNYSSTVLGECRGERYYRRMNGLNNMGVTKIWRVAASVLRASFDARQEVYSTDLQSETVIWRSNCSAYCRPASILLQVLLNLK